MSIVEPEVDLNKTLHLCIYNEEPPATQKYITKTKANIKHTAMAHQLAPFIPDIRQT